jgi:hypothetical protein
MARLNEPPAAPPVATAAQPAVESVDACKYPINLTIIGFGVGEDAHEICTEEDEAAC